MKTNLLIILFSTLLIAGSIVPKKIYYYSDPLGISLHRPEMDHSETLILAEHNPLTNDGVFDFREIVFYSHGDSSKYQKYYTPSSIKIKKHNYVRNRKHFILCFSLSALPPAPYSSV